jgi:hypothetical protein
MKWQHFLETERTEAVAGVERREGEKRAGEKKWKKEIEKRVNWVCCRKILWYLGD